MTQLSTQLACTRVFKNRAIFAGNVKPLTLAHTLSPLCVLASCSLSTTIAIPDSIVWEKGSAKDAVEMIKMQKLLKVNKANWAATYGRCWKYGGDLYNDEDCHDLHDIEYHIVYITRIVQSCAERAEVNQVANANNVLRNYIEMKHSMLVSSERGRVNNLE